MHEHHRFSRFRRRRRYCSSSLAALPHKTILDMQAMISLKNRLFDGNHAMESALVRAHREPLTYSHQ